MSELQAGMLALVIGCNSNPVNIGKIVTLSHKVVKGDLSPSGIVYNGDDGWLITGDGLIAVNVFGAELARGYSYAKADQLLPIKPEADPLDVTHKEELHA